MLQQFVKPVQPEPPHLAERGRQGGGGDGLGGGGDVGGGECGIGMEGAGGDGFGLDGGKGGNVGDGGCCTRATWQSSLWLKSWSGM